MTNDNDDKKVEPFKPLSSSSSEIEEIGFVNLLVRFRHVLKQLLNLIFLRLMRT